MIIHNFANEERSFCIGLGQIKALEKETNIGYYALYELLNFMRHSIDHIMIIIRLALVGGGMQPNEAQTLVYKEISSQPFMTYLPLARLILKTAIWGGDEVATVNEGKPQEEIITQS
jgi:hypothetical protein